MQFYRCRICGEVYMGKGRPSNCPFCGVLEKYMVPAGDWIDENDNLGEVTGISRDNVKKALQLEANNAPYYRDAMNKTGDIKLQGVFKYLSKIELEHASTLKKILKCEVPPPEAGKDVASGDNGDNFKSALIREKFATALYKRAAEEAVEPRIKEVFTALADVESDHVILEMEIYGRL